MHTHRNTQLTCLDAIFGFMLLSVGAAAVQLQLQKVKVRPHDNFRDTSHIMIYECRSAIMFLTRLSFVKLAFALWVGFSIQ